MFRSLFIIKIMILSLFLSLFLSSGCLDIKDNKYNSERYNSLLNRVITFDKSVDFKELRLAFTETKDYDPYFDSEIRIIRKDMYGALENKQYDTAIEHANSILKKKYVDIDAHLALQYAYKEKNNSKLYDYHKFIVEGLIKSILDSGDGKTPETAYLVIDVREEYVILDYFGFKPQRQTLSKINNHEHDEMEVIDTNTGEVMTLYFNVDIPLNWLDKQGKI